MAEAHVREYFCDYTFTDSEEALIPEIFVSDELVVSERARDLIQNFAPGFCYFAPVQFVGRQSGRPTRTPLFKTYIRRTLNYDGPQPREIISPQGARGAIVEPKTWTAFCQNHLVQTVAFELPIFLFNRASLYPILSASLLKHLKEHAVSGLLESTYYNKTTPKRPPACYAFETVFPLDPAYRA